MSPSLSRYLLSAALLGGFALSASPASAQQWIAVEGGGGYYAAPPAPRYYQAPPAPVYYAPPAPVYAPPQAPVYYQPPPQQRVYVQQPPQPVYVQPPQSQRPGFVGYLVQGGQQPGPYGARPAEEFQPVEGQVYYQQPQPRVAYAPEQQAPRQAYQPARSFNPKFLPQMVAYDGRESPGTIIIDTTNKFLFLVTGDGQAKRYGIGVGRPGFGWKGEKAITRKAEWPDWRPPAEMLARRPDLPKFLKGGVDNPLGARALYLGSSLYRIHGTNEPYTIGQEVSSGCFRLRNEDVVDLYNRVKVGTRVKVI